jgi:hypothetical protein
MERRIYNRGDSECKIDANIARSKRNQSRSYYDEEVLDHSTVIIIKRKPKQHIVRKKADIQKNQVKEFSKYGVIFILEIRKLLIKSEDLKLNANDLDDYYLRLALMKTGFNPDIDTSLEMYKESYNKYINDEDMTRYVLI